MAVFHDLAGLNVVSEVRTRLTFSGLLKQSFLCVKCHRASAILASIAYALFPMRTSSAYFNREVEPGHDTIVGGFIADVVELARGLACRAGDNSIGQIQEKSRFVKGAVGWRAGHFGRKIDPALLEVFSCGAITICAVPQGAIHN